ncbi:MAG: 6,7-dimethyl-8-ribityllumazine synthase [Curvibacter sp.]|nr:6,7-dimethyl-8-ribityllumazine synthase [Curvibacter sp.]
MSQKDHSLPSLAPTAEPIPLPPRTRFAFVEASWHADIVQQARAAFLAEMQAHGVGAASVDVIRVPGAFEIPLHARRLARTGRYHAIATCALVVDGGIYRHEFVAQTVVQALMTVQLETDVPVISAVLTPHHFHEHLEHRKYFHRHFGVKGQEAARACLETVSSLHRLNNTEQALAA